MYIIIITTKLLQFRKILILLQPLVRIFFLLLLYSCMLRKKTMNDPGSQRAILIVETRISHIFTQVSTDPLDLSGGNHVTMTDIN